MIPVKELYVYKALAKKKTGHLLLGFSTSLGIGS